MLGRLTCGAAVFSALLLAAPATAGPRVSSAVVDCSATQLTFLFWPQGHQAVPSVGFPAYPIPHTELYRTDPTFAGTNALGFFDSMGQGGFSKTCAAATGTPAPTIPSAATLSTTTAVNCTFPRSPLLELAAQSDGSMQLRAAVPLQVTTKVRVKVKHKFVTRTVTKTVLTTVLTDRMASSASLLTYDSKLCVPAAAPS
jgi:hypothetical protein